MKTALITRLLQATLASLFFGFFSWLFPWLGWLGLHQEGRMAIVEKVALFFVVYVLGSFAFERFRKAKRSSDSPQ